MQTYNSLPRMGRPPRYAPGIVDTTANIFKQKKNIEMPKLLDENNDEVIIELQRH